MNAKWEYAVAEVTFDGKSIGIRDHERNGSFDEMGEGGWELVAVQEVGGKPLAFFKREAQRLRWPPIEMGKGDLEDEPA